MPVDQLIMIMYNSPSKNTYKHFKIVNSHIKNGIVHQWSKQPSNVTTIPNFNKNYAAVAEMSRNLKRVGYLGIVLTGVNAISSIQKACTVSDDAQCSKRVKLRVVSLEEFLLVHV
ncbi:protein of unknown function [Moritella yayanosii]|uniref:Uncharacterized protein n=1 Tax=Moritella yayanosii TaxID=69539 RepID=A0A330LJ91_9GAMM|nr:protein of unknown function [Moritella yayanosii]